MSTFLSRHLRKIFAVVMSMVVVTMLFYGTGSSNASPQIAKAPDTIYKVGLPGKEREISKKKLDAMVTYLTYDFGYGINDAIDRQNIFSDGFFYSFLDSSLGKSLINKHFSLLKKDFAEKLEINRKKELYTHPSGKLVLENEIKIYADELYSAYRKVKDKNREVDASLLEDCVALFSKHRHFTPKDLKLLTQIFIRDRKMEHDPTWERRNFAIFGARSNVDVFGKAFVELAAGAVLAAEMFAKENGYHTTYEEAEGIITRRALDVIGSKYFKVVEKEELNAIKRRFQETLGLSQNELVEAACAILTVEKMLGDVDSLVQMDEAAAKKLYASRIEQLLVKMVQDSGKRSILTVMDALELQHYLSAIGPQEKFLEVPKTQYAKEDLYTRNADLLVKSYQVKLSTVTKKQVGNTIPLKRVWDYQASENGWKEIAAKFSFDASLGEEERFALLRGLDKKRSKQVEDFVRGLIVMQSKDMVEDCLAKRELKGVTLVYNQALSAGEKEKGFDMSVLSSDLDALENGAVLENYTQDHEKYARIVLLKKPEQAEFPKFVDAKRNGYLAAIMERKLKELNGGKELDEVSREKYAHFYLRHLAGDSVAKAIITVDGEGARYTAHKEARIHKFLAGEEIDSKEELLAQFNMYQEEEVVSRVGKNKEIAKEDFFEMEIGAKSKIHYLDRGEPYIVELRAKKEDSKTLQQVRDALHRNLRLEARNGVYKDIVDFIERDQLLEMSRLEEKEGA
ncbi:hypothetical protein K0U07_03165 [bacterium]|nr:hypothetical protein [bacterium]